MSGNQDHILKRELYRLVRTDSKIFDFIEDGFLDGIWYWDLENSHEEWLSPRFKKMCGYADHEIPDNSNWWQQNIHPDDLQATLDNLDEHKSHPGHPYDQIVRYRHKNGSTVWVRCRALIIYDETGN